MPPWLLEPGSLDPVTSEPFASAAVVSTWNPGKPRLPPGLLEPGSLDPVASETLPSELSDLADARATELTSNRSIAEGLVELIAADSIRWIGVGWGVGVGVGVGV